MKIRYMSDLHLELDDKVPPDLPSIGEDLVVLAGDIHQGILGVEWAGQVIRDRPVIYVLGNHEYFHNDWETLVDRCKAAAAPNVHVLENDAVQIADLTVLGCTLWSDFRANGDAEFLDARHVAFDAMAEYFLTSLGDVRLTTEATLRRNQQSVAWLKSRIEETEGPILVVTHHSPTAKNRNPRFDEDDELSPSFFSHLDWLGDSNKIVAWICGHNHHSSIVRFGSGDGVLLASNQRGYGQEHLARAKFRWKAVLDLKEIKELSRWNEGLP